MSFDDLFQRDRSNKTLQRMAAGMAVPCQSQRTGLASVPFSGIGQIGQADPLKRVA